MGIVKESLENILIQYKIWKTNKSFYSNQNRVIDLNNFLKLPCYHYTDVESINQCNSEIIVIDNLTESIHSQHFFCRYDKNKHYIIFTGGAWDKDKHRIGIENYDIIYYCFFLFELIDTYMSPHRFCFYLNKNYSFDYPKNYIFCSTIGNIRPERDKIVDAIIDHIPYKNFILRYSGENLGASGDELDVVTFKKGNFDPYTSIISKYHHNVSQSLPINMYNSCYVNLVVETDIDWQDSFFMTEKIVKTIISGMPFVVVSTPFFLKNLQALGFRSYNTVWDESYDNEVDYNRRIDKITNLITTFDTFQWQKHKKQLQEIADHNLRNLLNSDKIMNNFFNQFEEIVEKVNERGC